MMGDQDWLAARGLLAAGVAGELAEPLERVRQILAIAVDRLDRHIAGARGPEPLPWQTVSQVREDLMEAFLDLGRAARLAGDLAMATGTEAREASDINEVVERAAALARHRVKRECDLHLDLGSLPLTRVDGGQLAHALAHAISEAADAADAGSTILVRTVSDGTGVRVSIAHRTRDPRRAEGPFATLVRDAIAAARAEVAYLRNGDEVLMQIDLPIS
jgi:signal transduction histidine kinase